MGWGGDLRDSSPAFSACPNPTDLHFWHLCCWRLALALCLSLVEFHPAYKPFLDLFPATCLPVGHEQEGTFVPPCSRWQGAIGRREQLDLDGEEC